MGPTSSERPICAVIPAAGKGTRLGLAVPKILASLTPTVTVWDVLRTLLTPYVEHMHVILSPSGVRSNRRTPSEVSSATSLRPHVGCVTLSGPAAADKLPAR